MMQRLRMPLFIRPERWASSPFRQAYSQSMWDYAVMYQGFL